jgi:hypothetical protein
MYSGVNNASKTGIIMQMILSQKVTDILTVLWALWISTLSLSKETSNSESAGGKENRITDV